MEPLIAALVSALASGIGSWAAIKIELRWHKAAIDKLEERVTFLERNHASCLSHEPSSHR